MNINDIKNLINTSYREYELIQNPIEILEFSKFYYELKCKNILEIGTFFGGTFYLLCKLSDENGKKISLDYPFFGTPGGDSVIQNQEIIISNLKKFSKNVEVLTMDSHSPETLSHIENIMGNQEFDFIFIDGDHSYEGVKQDFEMYKHLLKDGGYIGFHDINIESSYLSHSCRVDLLWKELLENPDLNIIEFSQKGPGGIGVVQVFKTKKKLNIDLEFINNQIISLTNKDSSDLNVLVSIKDIDTLIPINFFEVYFTKRSNKVGLTPIKNKNWYDEKDFSGFLLEFYDNDENLIDSKELKIKNRDSSPVIKTRLYSEKNSLYEIYNKIFYEKIFDKHNLDNLNVVVDISANVGLFTNYITTKQAKIVHTIESSPKHFLELKKQFYYYNGVKCHNFSFVGFGNHNMVKIIDFYKNNNISEVDLLKININEPYENIFNQFSDEEILTSKRYIIIYTSKNKHDLGKLIDRFSNLKYTIENYENTLGDDVGYIFTEKKNTTHNYEDLIYDKKFPKRAYVTLTNEYYLPLVEGLSKSIQKNSKYPIIIYSINCDINFEYPNVYSKRINIDTISLPKFIHEKKYVVRKFAEYYDEENLPEDSLGIVDRSNIDTYLTLTRKPTIILDAIENGLEEGIFLDADGIAKENIDTIFEDYLPQCENYPLVGKGLFEYMMLYGLGDPNSPEGPLEVPLMNLIGVKNRTMHYVSSNFILFTNKMKNFIIEWIGLSNNKLILNENLKYAPYHDETLINVLLWKYNASKHLPLVHYNLTNSEKANDFYNTSLRNNFLESEWHYIPDDIDDIKFFHGCKSPLEIEKTIEIIEDFKKRKFNYKLKNLTFGVKSKIAIVTLFDDYYKDIAEVSLDDKIKYAKKHKYNFIFFYEKIDPSRPAQWSKIKAIEYVLKDYDWVWWIDIDALIMNKNIKIESIIDENFDIILTENKYSFISNGSSFFKNTSFTKKFLKECYDLNLDILKDIDIQTFDHEQKPMRKLIQSFPEYAKKIKLINERVCNSFWYTNNKSVLESYPNWNVDDNIYKPGDFVVNFCGRDKDERIKIMKNFRDGLI